MAARSDARSGVASAARSADYWVAHSVAHSAARCPADLVDSGFEAAAVQVCCLHFAEWPVVPAEPFARRFWAALVSQLLAPVKSQWDGHRFVGQRRFAVQLAEEVAEAQSLQRPRDSRKWLEVWLKQTAHRPQTPPVREPRRATRWPPARVLSGVHQPGLRCCAPAGRWSGLASMWRSLRQGRPGSRTAHS